MTTIDVTFAGGYGTRAYATRVNGEVVIFHVNLVDDEEEE